MKMPESSAKEPKTLSEKKKMLVTSNFSFSHSVFKRLVLQTRKNKGLFGKGLSCASVWMWHRYYQAKTFQRQGAVFISHSQECYLSFSQQCCLFERDTFFDCLKDTF